MVWLIHESRDPAHGLQFIQSELEKAEAANEKVYIISHIVPGNGDCWQIYTRELSKVVNRFEATLAGQFYGHTHKDEFKIFYDSEDSSRAINVAWIGSSLSTYGDVNPGYKVYILDGEREGSTFGMLDHEAWTMNLTEANIGPSEPHWFKLYDGRETFGLNSLSAQDMADLVHRFIVDDELFQVYYRNYMRQADPAILEGCGEGCKKSKLCAMVTTDFGDKTKCNEISRKMDLHD
ncbi:sphingomyelin phosphodiesterase-like [Artemia franciscana]|uniref:sphingomyelin phosphodiesterase-like n=1 Tax=Artemia franciscana TaxID=6661 RepID=UPI0032DB2119